MILIQVLIGSWLFVSITESRGEPGIARRDRSMVLIPAGVFLMGSAPKDGQVGFTVGVDELPQRKVELKAYYIDPYDNRCTGWSD